MLSTILMVFALVLSLCAAAPVPPPYGVNLGWLAFAFFVAALLAGGIGVLR